MWKSQFGQNWSQALLLRWGGDVMRVFDWESECRLSDWHTCLSAHRPGFHSVFKCILGDFTFPLIDLNANHHRLMFLASVLHLWKSEVNLYLLGCVTCFQILKISSAFDWPLNIMLPLVEQQHTFPETQQSFCLLTDDTLAKLLLFEPFNTVKLNMGIRQSFMSL